MLPRDLISSKGGHLSHNSLPHFRVSTLEWGPRQRGGPMAPKGIKTALEQTETQQLAVQT